jgi:hypothetical protein
MYKVLNVRIHDELGFDAVDGLTIFSEQLLPKPNDNRTLS